ncbi:MAG TPA: FHA domain-containing protein, partial [Pyrinomonadaceae bacterium]|nr:FHA domain-containing protein [Pyrinomonadaceae bacterium]
PGPAALVFLPLELQRGKFMTTCERCKTENLDGSQYCDECGAPLGAAAARGKKSSATGDTGGETNGKKPEHAEAALAAAGQPESAEQQSEVTKVAKVAAFAAASGAIAAIDSMHAKLVIERGRSAGKQFPLSDDESQIGRWDADGGIFPDVDLDADDPEAKVSRRHARIIRRNGQYYIEDLGSTNGTFINRGRRLLPGDRHPLRDGDEIIVGKTFLRFHVVK